MADATAQQGLNSFTIEHIYLKDCSFESPLSPTIFTSQMSPPEASVDIQNNVNTIEGYPDSREVVLSVTVEAKSDGRSLFVCEVHLAGLVNLGNDTDEALNRVTGIYVPEILFPYVRQTISDLITRGGFMPMLLQPIDFHAIYAQHNNGDETPLNG